MRREERRSVVWKLGGRHTHSRDKDGFRAVVVNGMEEGGTHLSVTQAVSS